MYLYNKFDDSDCSFFFGWDYFIFSLHLWFERVYTKIALYYLYYIIFKF